MNNKIIVINGPNINLLGEREQSQYGSINFEELRNICFKKSSELGLDMEFLDFLPNLTFYIFLLYT